MTKYQHLHLQLPCFCFQTNADNKLRSKKLHCYERKCDYYLDVIHFSANLMFTMGLIGDNLIYLFLIYNEF